MKPETVSDTLLRGTIALAKNTESPRADAQILLAFALRRDRTWLTAHGDTFITGAQAETFLELCARRATGLPIAYITGTAGFYRRDFLVNENVLIPRPETEHFIDEALEYLREKTAESPGIKRVYTVLDVGTGSGAIACTIAAEFPDALVEATDTSEKALKIAEYNAQRLNVQSRCKFHYADIVRADDAKIYDVVIANLPYIPTADLPRPPAPSGFEPREALDGGLDGLNYYRRLLAAIPPLLRPGALLLMEAAAPTMRGLFELATDAFPGSDPEVRYDYAGLERYISVKVPARTPV
ncbi:MAG: peptide chain release factor N(5)-glutamine methyltransferase [Candidatus Eremiobacteraeota bacterium]|nr:peptide chain release factor N(5)-glutamine methyltransferase [Candidatus Eremiobacteraeota bacterium]